MRVAIVGASNDRRKFGNRALRAHLARDFEVFPVNNHESVIEGIRVYARVTDIPGHLDRVSVYLPPERTMEVLGDIKEKGAAQLFLNPGSESPEVLEACKALGLEPILACSIMEIGESPADY